MIDSEEEAWEKGDYGMGPMGGLYICYGVDEKGRPKFMSLFQAEMMIQMDWMFKQMVRPFRWLWSRLRGG